MASLLNETSREAIEAELRRAAIAAHGEDRLADLAADLRGLAGALQRVGSRKLPLRDWPMGAP